jgi:type IV pilus assembly protein PilV
MKPHRHAAEGRAACRQNGVTLLEVLVSLVILCFGMLGLAGLQMSALKYNSVASTRSGATLLASELSDRMRSNMAGVKASNYARNMDYATAIGSPVTAPACGSTTDCSAAQLAQLDLANWLARIGTALPSGTGAILPTAGNASVTTIVLMWKEQSLMETASTDPSCPTPPVVGVRCFQTTFMP